MELPLVSNVQLTSMSEITTEAHIMRNKHHHIPTRTDLSALHFQHAGLMDMTNEAHLTRGKTPHYLNPHIRPANLYMQNSAMDDIGLPNESQIMRDKPYHIPQVLPHLGSNLHVPHTAMSEIPHEGHIMRNKPQHISHLRTDLMTNSSIKPSSMNDRIHENHDPNNRMLDLHYPSNNFALPQLAQSERTSETPDMQNQGYDSRMGVTETFSSQVSVMSRSSSEIREGERNSHDLNLEHPCPSDTVNDKINKPQVMGSLMHGMHSVRENVHETHRGNDTCGMSEIHNVREAPVMAKSHEVREESQNLMSSDYFGIQQPNLGKYTSETQDLKESQGIQGDLSNNFLVPNPTFGNTASESASHDPHDILSSLRLKLGNSFGVQHSSLGDTTYESTGIETKIDSSECSSMDEKLFSCVECGKKFKLKYHLDIHSKTHSGKKPYNCALCNKCFSTSDHLVRHTRVHTKEKSHECLECGKTFAQRSMFNCHMRVHTGEKPYECKECGRKFSQRASLRYHKTAHTGEKRFECGDCGKKYNDHKSFKEHKRSHTGEMPLMCMVCGCQFSTRYLLKSHENSHNNENPFTCSYCGKAFGAKFTLTVHMKIHTGDKAFECTECGRKFIQKANLMGHMRTHTGEKPFPCPHCDKRFGKKNHLDAHVSSHSGQKPFECVCGKRFSWKSGLDRHKIVHGPQGIYECQVCKEEFPFEQMLQDHAKTHRKHTGETRSKQRAIQKKQDSETEDLDSESDSDPEQESESSSEPPASEWEGIENIKQEVKVECEVILEEDK